MSGIDYELTYFDTTAQLAEDPSFPSAGAQSLASSNVAASLDVSAADLNTTFLFKTDDVDITDVSASDILYAIDYNDAGVVKWPEIAIGNATINSGGTNTAVAAAGTDNIKNDFVRFMAFKMLGSLSKTDIFNNESVLVADMESRNAEIQGNVRGLLALSGTTASPLDNSDEGNTNVVKHLLEQTIAGGEHSRFRDDYTGSVGDFTRFVFKSGDSLKLRVVYSPKQDQPVSGLNAIGTQSYTITLNLN